MKKCKCGKPAVFFRIYEGRYLCEKCFCRSIEKKAKKNIRQHKLISPGDRIGIAVSGGKDSMVTLYIMSKIIKPRRDMEITAITIDEGIKGYRDVCIKRVKDFCKKLGVEHKVFSFKEEFGKTLDEKIKEIKSNRYDIDTACTFCGVGRRYVLNKKSRELGLTKICLGHNLDDEVQSVLMNYMRGDLQRASRMGPEPIKEDEKFIPRIKPLRIIPENETTLFAMLKKIPFYNKHCPYRTGLRLEIRDFINKMEDKHPGIKLTVLETFDKMHPLIKEFVKQQENKVFYCEKCGEPSSKKICKTCVLWR